MNVNYSATTNDCPSGNTIVAGIAVDSRAFARLGPDEALAIAESMVQGDEDEHVYARLLELSPFFATQRRAHHYCRTPLVRFLQEAGVVQGWPRGYSQRLEEVLFYFAYSDQYLTLACPNFDIMYTTDGPDAVNPTDGGGVIVEPGTGNVVGTLISGNGIPDYIERICFWLERALAVYTGPNVGFKNPVTQGKIQVSVSKTGGDYSVGNFIHFSTGWNPNMIADTANHELMHVCQSQYQTGTKEKGFRWLWSMLEGGADLACDFVCDAHNHYIWYANVLRQPTVSLIQNDASARFNRDPYRFSLFLKYLCEQQSPRVNPWNRPTIGAEAYRTLFGWFDWFGYNDRVFELAVDQLPWYQSFYRFSYADPAKLDEVSSETLLGNFYLALYLKDLGVNQPDRRFYLMENEDFVLYGKDFIGPVDTFNKMEPCVLTSQNTLHLMAPVVLANFQEYTRVSMFAAQLDKVDIGADIDSFRVEFAADAAFVDPIVQVALIESGGTVRDIIRTDRSQWSRTFASERNRTRLDHILITVIGTETGGLFSLRISDAPAAPDVMITRWNHKAGTHYPIDSFNWAWTWISPDIWVDNNGDGRADALLGNGDNLLFVRLHNQGSADAVGIEVEFWYQNATVPLNPTGWQPVRDSAGTPQKLTGLTLAAGATGQWAVHWFPSAFVLRGAFSIRAVVTVPGDPNTDNKRAITSIAFDWTTRFQLLLWERTLPIIFFPRRADPLPWAIPQVQAVPRTGGRWTVSATDLARAQLQSFEPGQAVREEFRLISREVKELQDQTNHEQPYQTDNGTSPRVASYAQSPDPFGDYPTDPEALPPGFDDVALMTLDYTVGGKVLGGFTWTFREESS